MLSKRAASFFCGCDLASKKLVGKEISDEELKERFLEEIEQLEINLAVAQGKVKDFQLKKRENAGRCQSRRIP